MNMEDQDNLDRARLARDKLASRLLNQPGIRLIIISRETGQETGNPKNNIVLRVYISPGAELKLDIPDEVDGIPVKVIRSDVQLQ